MLFIVPVYASGEVSGTTEGIGAETLSQTEMDKIESWVHKNIKDGKIPGASVVIIRGNETIYSKGFGYADIDEQRSVTPETLFEIGSTSKAFTGLALLKLESEGKIDFDQSVKSYLPWFQMKYEGDHKGESIDGTVDITLNQLMHQTSGIPFKSIGDIPAGNSSDAIERTVRTQVGKYLDFFPGEHYQYATINYDILGLIIEEVSGMSFEEYISENVLEKLELNNTYLTREEALQYDMSKGYKLGFLKPREYEAPMYRGNLPAGYFIMNSDDVAKWLKIQIGTQVPEQFDENLISLSHIQDRTVSPDYDGSSYAVGWKVYQSGGGEFSHGGSNPNYSSQFVFRPEEQIAIGVLANLNSTYTVSLAEGLMDIMQKEGLPETDEDLYKNVDNASFMIFSVSIALALITLLFSLGVIKDFIKGERKLSSFKMKNLYSMFLSTLFIGFIGYCLYSAPNVLFWNLPWDFVFVWAPSSFIPAIVTLWSAIVLFGIYFQMIFYFPKKNEKPFFPLIILSFVSGFGNAFILFTINEAVSRIRQIEVGLILYFFLGLLLYVIGQKLIKEKMIKMTHEVIFEKRVLLIENILNTSLDKLDSIGEGKVYAGLNNDTEMISRTPSIIIGVLTDTVTMICCFVYLGIINIFGLLISIAVIIMAAALFYFVGEAANGLLEESRDTQNVFFAFINDLVDGFKELSMNTKKSNQFRDDMVKSCDHYKTKRVAASLKFVNAGIVGDLLFTLVIATVAFVFPYIFTEIQTTTLSTYIFVFLYITTPINGVLRSIPEFFNLRVSWKRINEFIKHVSDVAEENQRKAPIEEMEDEIKLKIKDVAYEYRSEDKIFRLGKVNLEVKSGEILFITGGNGSGKSTLAKILTGLYKPSEGRVFINNREVEMNEISEYYSHVFSDFHLFKKLYGVDCSNRQEEIQGLLELLQIEDKVEIKDGEFSTLKLSTGQRKRLALLVSYLEDKQIFIFDEWAADQDPEFRKYFYHNLIQDLRDRGKCVIVISHDDGYFHVADTLIKMEMGKIVKVDKPRATLEITQNRIV